MTEPSIKCGASPGEQEFQALFEAHFADVWRFARRRCASGADADDISAEVFAVTWRRWGDFPADQARFWLFGVARRVLANHRRSVDRQTRLRGQVAQESSLSVIDDYGSETDGALRRALAALSEEDRELLIMQAWDELPVAAIAALLGCSRNAASLRLFKARRRLAAELERKKPAAKGHIEVEPLEARKECHERS